MTAYKNLLKETEDLVRASDWFDELLFTIVLEASWRVNKVLGTEESPECRYAFMLGFEHGAALELEESGQIEEIV